jgi:hypothetical protein
MLQLGFTALQYYGLDIREFVRFSGATGRSGELGIDLISRIPGNAANTNCKLIPGALSSIP